MDSSVSIATGYGLDDREVGVRVPVRSRIKFSVKYIILLCFVHVHHFGT
jgi:hypothetical protein